jgi:hypothetical protein
VQEQTLEELLENWKEERVSAKEAIDQILRYVQLLRERLRALERGMHASPPPASGPSRTPAQSGRPRREASLRAFTAWISQGRIKDVV